MLGFFIPLSPCTQIYATSLNTLCFYPNLHPRSVRTSFMSLVKIAHVTRRYATRCRSLEKYPRMHRLRRRSLASLIRGLACKEHEQQGGFVPLHTAH